MDNHSENKTEPSVKPQMSKKEDILGKTPYGKEKNGEDNTRSRILGLLGDVTYPLSAMPLIRDPLERSSREKIAEEFSVWKLRQELHDKRTGRNEALTEAEQTERRKDQDEWIERKQEKEKKFIDDVVNYKMNELLATTTMTRLRDKAQELSERYLKSKVPTHSTTESYFMRNATGLWEQMQSYVRDYLEFSSGMSSINIIDKDPEEVIQIMKTRAKKMLFIKKDGKDNTESATEVEFFLHTDNDKDRYKWDQEQVSLVVSKDNGDIEQVTFDERFDHVDYCSSLEQMMEAYKNGIALTPSQIQLLLDRGMIDVSSLTDIQNNQLESAGKSLARLIIGEGQKVDAPPMFLFPFVLPTNLAGKVTGRSRGYAYMTHVMEVGPLSIGIRLHDYGSYQFISTLSTKGLTEEEAYSLVESYIKVLKAFPRVPKAKKTT